MLGAYQILAYCPGIEESRPGVRGGASLTATQRQPGKEG